MAWKKLDLFVIDTLGKIIQAGGESVTDKVYQERLKICKGCPKAGIVQPVPTIKIEGCTLCGCPFRTKLKTATYFDTEEKRTVQTTCANIEKGDGTNYWKQIEDGI